jgi:hypothetical protein
MINPTNGWKWNVEELQRQLQGINTSNVYAEYNGQRTAIQTALDSVVGRIDQINPFEDIYEPAWINLFDIPAQDSGGNTLLSSLISPGAQVLYVSPDGDDETGEIYSPGSFDDIFAYNFEMAFATIAAAQAVARTGMGDVILLRRGGTYQTTGPIVPKGGISVSERAIIAPYGEGAKPVIERRFNTHNANTINFGDGAGRHGNYTVLKDLVLTWPERDPTHEDFVGWDNLSFDGIGVSLNKTFDNLTGILVEGLEVAHTTIGLNVGGLNTPYSATNIIVRNSIMRNTFKSNVSGAAHPQGLGVSSTGNSILIENMLFIECGYYQADWEVYPFLAPTPFSHSMYLISPKETIVRNWISYAPSSIHLKTTATVERNLAVSLTGLATEIEVTGIYPQTPQTGMIAIKPQNHPQIEIPYVSWADGKFQIVSDEYPSGYDFTATPVTGVDVDPDLGVNRVAVNFPKSYDVSVYGAIMADGEVGVSYGGNENTCNSNARERFSNYRVQGNIAARLGHYQIGGRPIAWNFGLTDNKDSLTESNICIGPDNPATNDPQGIQVIGYSDDNTIRLNHSYDGAGDIRSTTIGAGDRFYANARNLPSSAYVDASRGIESFAASKGFNATVIGFRDYLLTLNTQSIKTVAAQCQKHIRDGFVLVEPLIFQQPNNLSLLEGQSGTIRFDAIGNGLPTFQWFNVSDDSEIEGATGNEYRLTLTEADDGRQVYCVADVDGVQLTSNPATITVVQPRLVPRIAGTDYIDLSARQDLTSGKGIRFKFRLNAISGTGAISAIRTGAALGGVTAFSISSSQNKIDIRRGG